MRNFRKRDWLLAGLLKCDVCKEFAFTALLGKRKHDPQRYYRCNSQGSERARKLKTACYSPHVYADVLERRVWEEIQELIYDPRILIQRLEERNTEDYFMGMGEQLEFIDDSLEQLKRDRSKIEAAYQRNIYTLDEFEQKMLDIKRQAISLEGSRARIETKIAEQNSIDVQKHIVLTALGKIKRTIEQARKNDKTPNEIPFELKRKILSVLIEVIWVDSKESTFTIEGEIKGTYAIESDFDEDESSLTSGRDAGGFGIESSRILNSKRYIQFRVTGALS